MRFRLALLLPCMLLLSGCYTITMDQKINKDGSSTLSATYDFSLIANAATMYIDSQPAPSKSGSTLRLREQLSCDGLTLSRSREVKKITCTDLGDYKIKIDSELKLSRPFFNVRKADDKTYYILRAPLDAPISRDDVESMAPIDPPDNPNAKGPTVTYTLTMPAKIVRAPGGKISGRTITFTEKDLLKKSRFTIIAVD